MLILTIRTDNPEAEIGLYESEKQLSYASWQAHRQLSETIHTKILGQLKANSYDWKDIEGIVVFKGPGSFTGLRIGITVANILAASLTIPIVSAMDEDWIQRAIKRLSAGENETIALPEYGALPNITQPRK